MSVWKVRHEGSPMAVEMTLAELQQELLDGRWDTTDEVMGPGESEWVAIENHPVFEELAEELEAPPPRHDEEAHLDMNALIDVCLVLLVFYILTSTVAALQKRLEAPTVTEDKAGVPIVTKEKVEQSMIHVTAKMEEGNPVIRIEKTPVEPHRLVAELRKFVRASGKTILLLEHDDTVSQETVVKIIDSAKGAGMNSVRLLIP